MEFFRIKRHPFHEARVGVQRDFHHYFRSGGFFLSHAGCICRWSSPAVR